MVPYLIFFVLLSCYSALSAASRAATPSTPPSITAMAPSPTTLATTAATPEPLRRLAPPASSATATAGGSFLTSGSDANPEAAAAAGQTGDAGGGAGGQARAGTTPGGGCGNIPLPAERFKQTTYWSCVTTAAFTHCGCHIPILDASVEDMGVSWRRGGASGAYSVALLVGVALWWG